MGWIYEIAAEHEGYAACRVGDPSMLPDEWLVTGGPDGPYIGGHSLATDPLVIGWRAACACGWFGARAWERRADDDSWPPESIEDACHDEWAAHAALPVTLAELAAAAEAAEQARSTLAQAVTTARAAGANWADIGRATQMSRQAARERWGAQDHQPLARNVPEA